MTRLTSHDVINDSSTLEFKPNSILPEATEVFEIIEESNEDTKSMIRSNLEELYFKVLH